jgi:hypothetical protein
MIDNVIELTQVELELVSGGGPAAYAVGLSAAATGQVGSPQAHATATLGVASAAFGFSLAASTPLGTTVSVG